MRTLHVQRGSTAGWYEPVFFPKGGLTWTSDVITIERCARCGIELGTRSTLKDQTVSLVAGPPMALEVGENSYPHPLELTLQEDHRGWTAYLVLDRGDCGRHLTLAPDRLYQLGSNALLNAPCVWCQYNGPGYWQADTHGTTCPMRSVGGGPDRVTAMRLWFNRFGISIFVT